MKPFSLLGCLLPMAVLASTMSKRSAVGQTVAFWGQNPNRQPLANYCSPESGYDILVLTYINTIGNRTALAGQIGDCVISAGNATNCDSLKKDVDYCQSQGKKVLLSIGGWGANYHLNNQADAENVGQALWNSWAAPVTVDKTALRPIGDSFVDGWDIDVLSNPDNSGQYLGDLVNALQSNFAGDQNHTYVITGTPQCPLPDANMNQAIISAKFDYLFIQFFNNPSCSPTLLFGKPVWGFNYEEWSHHTENTTSADAKLFLGLYAGANSTYYVAPENIPTVVDMYKNDTRFGGVMIWDADLAASVNVSGRTYGQHIKEALTA